MNNQAIIAKFESLSREHQNAILLAMLVTTQPKRRKYQKQRLERIRRADAAALVEDGAPLPHYLRKYA